MALSGSFNTTAYSGRYLTLSWTATQDIATNTSTISWTLKGAGGSSIYYKAGAFKVVIAGETVYSSSTRIQLYSGTVVASGTKKIQHNSDGKKSFSASAEAAIYYTAVNCKGSGSWELNDIPIKATFTSAPDFTDEDNPTIYYTNPTGNKASDLLACIANANGTEVYVPYRSISKTGTSYTFNLTDADKQALWNASANSGSIAVRFYLRTVINGTNHHSFVTKTLTIVNGAPVVAVEVYDDNRSTVAATGNNQVIVKGVSDVSYRIIGTPRKGATITAYGAINNDYFKAGDTGTYFDVTNGEFEFMVADSRGYVQGIRKSLQVIDYKQLTTDLSVNTNIASGSSDMDVTLNINGTFFTGNFSASKMNTLELYYKYKTGSGDYGDWIRITNVNVNPTTYSYTASVELTMDYREAYTFRVLAKDLVEERLTKEVSILTKPIFDWSKTDFNFNVPISINGEQMSDFVIEQEDNGTYAYRKWASGKLEAWRTATTTVSVSANTAYGSLYYHDNLSLSTTGNASQFVAIDTAQLTFNKGGASGLWIPTIKTWSISGGQAKITYMAINPTKLSAEIIPCVYIVGRWK